EGEWPWRSREVVTRQTSMATSSFPDRDAAQPSAAYPQLVAGGGGHAQDAEGAEPASGTGLPRIPAVVRADNTAGPVLARLRFPGPVRQGQGPAAPGAVAAVQPRSQGLGRRRDLARDVPGPGRRIR